MASREQFINSASTTLSADMTAGQTTASVSDGGAFPATGDFRILIGTELMLVTARSGNTLTVVREIENSNAVAHSSTDAVDAILTAGALETYAEENTWHGNTAPPLRIENLSTGVRATVSDFTWVNQGSATATDRGNRIMLSVPAFTGAQLRGLFMSAPSAPYSITLACRGMGKRENYGQFGLAFRESSSGKLIEIVKLFNEQLEIPKHNSPTSYNSSLLSATNWAWGPGVVWFKIEDDNTTLKFYTGINGLDWQLMGSEGRTVFMSGGPNQVGFFGNPASSNSFPMLIEIYHFGAV
ncbi:MAG: hypothetical protein ACW987_13995 [Candidatus Thorarchaeota archaeon]|jgi:hypothetical protein